MNTEVYNQALAIEHTDPGKALKLYTYLKREAMEFRWDILVIGTLCPVVAYGISLLVQRRFNIHPALVTILVWCYIGFFPTYQIWHRVRLSKARVRLKTPYNITIPLIHTFSLFFKLVSDILVFCLVASLTAFFLFSLVGTIYQVVLKIPVSWKDCFGLPMFLELPIMTISGLYGLLVILGEPARLPDNLSSYLFAPKRILTGVKLKYKQILFLLITYLFARIMSNGNIGWFYSNPSQAIMLSIWGGILFSLNYGFLERDYVLAQLFQAARIRCLIYLGRKTEAEFLAIEMEAKLSETQSSLMNRRSDFPQRLKPIIEAMIVCTRYINTLWDHEVSRVLSSLNFVDVYFESKSLYKHIYLDTIRNIKRLALHSPDEYNGIGRAVETSLRYPDEYSTSDQSIDIEVIDGEMYYDRIYHKGELIIGVWEQAKDFEYFEVRGRPTIGDTVGYYTHYVKPGMEVHVWEKIECNQGTRELKAKPTLYKQASNSEKFKPKKSLQIYRRLERQNTEFHPSSLLVGILSPVIGFIIASQIELRFNVRPTLATWALWLPIGFGPYYILRVKRDLERAGYDRPARWERKISAGRISFKVQYLLCPLLFFMYDIARLILLNLYAGILWFIISVPIIFFFTLVTSVSFIDTFILYLDGYGVYFLIICYVICAVFFIPDPLRFVFIRNVVTAIRLGASIFIELSVSSLIALIFFLSLTGFSYNHPVYSFFISLLAGFLSGIRVVRSVDDARLQLWLCIAKARCLLRMGRSLEAKWHLESFEDPCDFPVTPDAFWKVLSALNLYRQKAKAKVIMEALNDAERLRGKRLNSICHDNIQRTRQLIRTPNG